MKRQDLAVEWKDLPKYVRYAGTRDVLRVALDFVARWVLEACVDLALIVIASMTVGAIEGTRIVVPGWMWFAAPLCVLLALMSRTKLAAIIGRLRYRRWIVVVLLILVLVPLPRRTAWILLAAPQALDCFVSGLFSVALRGRQNLEASSLLL